MARCAATKLDGGRCSLPATPGEPTCWNHDPAHAAKRKRNASRAVKARYSGPLEEIEETKERARQLFAGVVTGKVEPKVAAVANQLLATLLRAVEQERRIRETQELEGRVGELEELLSAPASNGKAKATTWD